MCTFAHSSEELLTWSRDVGYSNRFERATGNVYHPPSGATDQFQSTAGSSDSNFYDVTKAADKSNAEQSLETIEDVRDRIRNVIGTLGMEV